MGTADKLAVLGAGNWGRNVLRSFAELLGPDRVICCDADLEVLRRTAQRHPGIASTTDVDKVLADAAVKSVAIATPAASHFELASSALAAGKHVFVEKPMTLNARDGESLVRQVEGTGLTLMVDHVLVYHPAVQELTRLAREGGLGRIQYMYTQRANLGVVRTEENALWSLGVHDVAVALDLFGHSPSEIAATGGSFLQRERKIEDVVFVSMRFPDGELAHLHLSWLDPHKIRKTTVVGSKKMAVLDDVALEEKLKIYDKGVTVLPESHGATVRYGDIVIPNVPLTEPLKAACRHFLDRVESGATPRSDGRSGLEVVRVLEAAQSAMDAGGSPVSLSGEAVRR